MRKLYFIALTLILLINSNNIFSQGHKIDVQIKGAENQEMLLVHIYGNKHFIDDTLRFDVNGRVTIKGDTLLPEGFYTIYWPGKRNLEVLIGKDQEFSMKTDTSDMPGNLVIKDSDESNGLIQFQRFMTMQNIASNAIQERMKQNVLNPDSLKYLQDLQDIIALDTKEFWKKTAENTQNELMSIVARLMLNIEIPTFSIPKEIENKDSMQWLLSYSYNKAHFFDNVPMDDPRILRTPIFYNNKFDHFFKKMLPQHPDTLSVYALKVLEKTNGNQELINYYTRYFIDYSQKSDRMGMDKLFVEVSENYILTKKADWVTEETLLKIREEVAKQKPNLIGEIAQDLKLESIKGEKIRLHDIKSKFTLVYFWEPDCGHCKKTTPKVWEMYQKYDRADFDVYAVCTIADKEKWTKYIDEKAYSWINVYDPHHLSNFRFFYNIYSTPTMYLLDENKKIIAKRFGFESLEEILKIELEKE